MNKKIKEANNLYKEKNFEAAIKKYEEVIADIPELKKILEFNINLSVKKLQSKLNLSEKFHEPSISFEEINRKGLILDCAAIEPNLLDLIYAKMPIDQEKVIVHKEDLISVIMPSYNNEKYIARAINSILSQVGVVFELIIVDDGSTDASVQVAQEIAKNHKNIKVISLIRNFGCYYARNVGLVHATGKWITVVDSDDIISPNRLKIQLDYLNKNPSALGCRCHQRRWSDSYEYPMSDLKPGENSLIWQRDLIGKIGFYDSVRYSGDAEFRLRIQRSFGTNSVLIIPEELYFTRTVAGSLTTNNKSKVFSVKDKRLEVEFSPQRKAYLESFSDWQKSNKKNGMYIGFPLFERPFKIGSDDQSASPYIHQRIVGCMASFPPRREALEKTVKSIIAQVDELRIYLNNYDEIPDFLKIQKVKVTLGKDALGDLRDNGKFYSLPSDDNTYVFTFDDDLIYPVDYVSKLIFNIEMLNRGSIVGVHGVIFPENEFTTLAQRKVFQFSKASNGYFVDLLGTGTCAWHSSTFKPKLENFKTPGVCDLWFSAVAASNHIPLFTVKREKNWVVEPRKHDVSLYKEAVESPDLYFSVYNAGVKHILNNGLVRKISEEHYKSGFDAATLAAAGIELYGNSKDSLVDTVCARKNIVLDYPFLKRDRVSNFEYILKFSIVVNGWNCCQYIDNVLRSIANLQPGPFIYDVILVDDGSDDGGYEKIINATILPKAKVIRIQKNTGPAYARHVGIRSVTDKDSIVVLVDMDDELDRAALRVVAEKYLENKKCLMTIGNWVDQNGKKNPQGFYTKEEIDQQATRSVEMFNATHLRTFKRPLYDVITDDDLKDHNGKWLETCTDVAIMYPLMDQCWSDEIEFILDPIYRYTRQHGGGTLARFGKPHKVERLNWLKAKMPKNKFNKR